MSREGLEDSIAPPLVHLSSVIDSLTKEESFKLKEELLVAVSSRYINHSATSSM